ncbi:MAG TPA: pseudouridine synthase [Saprospiraceae bacterium]|nr:pseudouridine synthase [Saprospiraceae bacterium]
MMQTFSELVLYKDHHIVVCYKPATMPVQDDLTEDASLQFYMEKYFKQKLHLCNRLDRPAAGLVVFGKHAAVQTEIQTQMERSEFKKKYLVLVSKKDEKLLPELKHYIKKQTSGKSWIQNNPSEGFVEVTLKTSYIQEGNHYDLIEIETGTGKFHQIRAQLSAAGFPIKGDVKYGARRKNEDRSIALLAWQLNFKHPSTKADLEFFSPWPDHDIWNYFEPKKSTV